MRNKFLVYQSKTHRYLRCSLMLLTLFNFFCPVSWDIFGCMPYLSSS